MIMYNIMNCLLTLVPRSFINKLLICFDPARFIQPILILAVAACVLSSDNGARYITLERWKSTLETMNCGGVSTLSYDTYQNMIFFKH